MTFTLELTDDEAGRVRAAQQNGIDVSALMRGVISGLPPLVLSNSNGETKNGEHKNGSVATAQTAENNAMLALLEKWREEDEKATPEEREENERQWETLKQGINANRAEAGARLIF